MDLGAWQREFELWVRSNFPDRAQELQAMAVIKEAVYLAKIVLERSLAPHGLNARIEEDILQELRIIITAATWIAFLSTSDVGNVLLKRWAEGSRPEHRTDVWGPQND